ncbi:MAG: pyridoxal phosphate-dependent aminotransferase [Mogibacterium sp.]|nr:pyridoxal phosphate-dependent aminotransferase [Mogibacterium sp.]
MELRYVERRNTDCIKWDALEESFGSEGLLPLWVADMDFRIDESVVRAVSEYIGQGVPGYYKVPDSYYDTFIKWEKEEHGLEVCREWIRFSPGIVTGFHFAVQMFTEPGDAVIVNTPVYYPFLNAVKNNGRTLIKNELINDSGRYSIDLEAFERDVTENDVKLFILCSPHNPVSRVWHRDEISGLIEICRRHGVTIISDEIHHDLVFGENTHIPTLSLADDRDKVIMMTSASKTFNLAGLQNSFVVIPDAGLRAVWDSFTKGIRVQSGNAVGYIAARAAYENGKPWLEEVRNVIAGNYAALAEVLERELSEAVLSPLEGTYLAWLDLGAYLAPGELKSFMQDKCSLAFDYGEWFGGEGGGSHIRINLATSRENVLEAADRMIRIRF